MAGHTFLDWLCCRYDDRDWYARLLEPVDRRTCWELVCSRCENVFLFLFGLVAFILFPLWGPCWMFCERKRDGLEGMFDGSFYIFAVCVLFLGAWFAMLAIFFFIFVVPNSNIFHHSNHSIADKFLPSNRSVANSTNASRVLFLH